MTSLSSRTIENLRLPLACLVVFEHSFGAPVGAGVWSDWSFYDLVRVFVSHIVAPVAVPCFFFVSGLLFFKSRSFKSRSFGKKEYLQKLRSRWWSVGIPFLAWTLLNIPESWLVACVQGRGATFFASLASQPFFFWSFTSAQHTGILGNDTSSYFPLLGQAWYLRDLMVVFALSPLLFRLIRLTKTVGIVLLGLCFCLGLWVYLPGVSILAFFFFAWGASFELSGKDFVAAFRKGLPVALPVFAVACFLSLVFYHNDPVFQLVQAVSLIAGLVSLFGLTSLLVERKSLAKPPRAAADSFFLYMAHLPLFVYPAGFLSLRVPAYGTAIALLSYFAVPLFAICACLLLGRLLQKCFPRLASVLLGFRRG